jgi:hypothetical protein
MRKILLFILITSCFSQYAMAQPATVSVPVALGRNNCGGSGGLDSVYYFNYTSPNLTNGAGLKGCKPVLKVNYAPLTGYSTANKPFTVFDASIAFNPKDQMLYYVWTDYNIAIPYKSYIWRWSPTACPTAAGGLDTVRTFNTDIGGLTFDANGVAYQLEFLGPAPYKAFLRTVDFTTGVIGTRDTLDLTGGKKLWNVGSGDITLTPSGQMYFVFDNKLFTPDYGSYNGPTHHIKCTYIDTIKAPSGVTSLPGLAFGNGDLIASYTASACTYRRINGVTGDTAVINYTYPNSKGVRSTDMTQINSGIGSSKKLVSVTATAFANQYDIVYDVYVRNYGNVPITNVQVSDNLGSINGAANVSNVSATLLSNPAGVTLSGLYNGTTVTNLLATGQSLPCYPVANNNFTIRISCTLSNIVSGKIYNNSAVSSANGYNNAALRDSSTNGSNPDLNQNDKPDDVGESDPTPFVIILTPTTPPCATLAQTLYKQDFASGTGLVASVSAGSITASSAYTGVTTTPVPVNRFTVTQNANNGDVTNWITLLDHTGGTNGRMLLVNADAPASVMYRDTLPVSCPGQQYSASLWAAFIGNTTYQTVCDGLGGFKYPKLTMRIRDLSTGLTITQFTTADITPTSWQQLGMKWVMPSGYSNVILEILNAGPGGCGNDIAIDDIVYGICDPVPTVSLNDPAGACLGSSVTFTASVADPAVVPGTKDYQWQWSPSPGTGPWTNIGGANAVTYTINPVNAADTGRYYRVIVAAQGNIGITSCQYISPGVKLLGAKPSVAPTSISVPTTTVCSPGSFTLTANGGTLGTSANYQWGTGSVIGTDPIPGATNSTYGVTGLTSTTTFWVRIENTKSPCVTETGGVTVTINVNQPSVAPTSITGADFCNPGSTVLTANGGTLGTGANYQWGTGSVIGTNPIAGATNPTLTVSPTTTTTYWVRIQNTTAPCTALTGGVTKVVTVLQPSTGPSSITAPSATFCNSGTVTLTAVGGILGTGAHYQWGTGSVVGVNPIAGATNSTYLVSALTTTTTFWVRIENTTSPCAAETGGATTTITINNASVAPTAISGTGFCNPGSTVLTATGGTLGTGANYQWGTGSVIGTNPIAGATGSTLTVSPTVTTTYWVRIENTISPCTANTGGVTKVLTVYQPSTGPSSITAPSYTFCNTGTVTLTAVGGTLGTGANYQWGTGAVVGVNPIAGATNPTYAVIGLTSTTTYWVRIENTTSPCTAETGGATTTININTSSVAPTAISGTGFCNPGSTVLTATGGTLGAGANYQWGTGAVIGSNPIVGATGPTLTISPTLTTTYWVRIENTSAPCTANTGGTTKVITITQPSVAPASITAPSTSFCTSGSVTLTAAGGTLGTGANYQWGLGSVVGVNPIAGATNPTYAVVGITSTTAYWVRIENTAAPCTSTTGGTTVVLTVNTPSVAPTSITGTGYCNPGTTTLTANGGTLGTGANYQWGIGSVVGTNPIPGETGPTLTVSPTVTTTYWVRIENNASPCTANSAGVTKVLVVSQPSVAAAGATKNRNGGICPGIPVQLGITGGSLGTNANWKWYTGSCSGTLVGTGATITVTPSVNTTYYVRAEGDCNITACVAVTVTISCDIDKDKDGIPDWVESNISAAFAGSPIINAYNPAYAGYVDNNNDYINDNFQADGDSDNDGTPNYLDTDFPGRVDSNGDGVDDRFDADLDGRINMLDLDSDNDGIPDVVEAYGVDTNGDGLIDNFTDTDGDGLSQNVDANNTGASNTGAGLGRIDFDGDGYPNFLDLDSDNDGIPDLVEAGGTDGDNNGRVDTFVDANNDGWSDSFEGGPNALLRTGADANNDGRADTFPYKNMDGDAKPNPYDVDSDGDGIVDVVEAGLPDANLNGIVDGTIGTNGWSTTISSMGTLTIRNSDGDIYPDYLDIDADNDGITDNVEGQTTVGYKVPATADADGDGLATVYDQTVGFGGGGIYPVDTDMDGKPDYLDLDSDADGQIDRVEGNDFNFNKLPDDIVSLTGVDTDGDGLDDRFDNDNTFAKVTSAYMGNGGSYTGPTPPGTRSVVQSSWPTQSDRDWRYVGNVLLVDILKFSGVPQGDNVLLNWTIVADKEIDRFEIERSTDNNSYTKVGTVKEPVTMQVQQSFSYTDNVSAVNSDVIYYKLKVIGKAGEVKYSNILVIRRTQTRTPVKIMPNPANNYVSIRFFAEKDGEVTINMIDNIGKLIFTEKQKVIRGNNTVQLNDLSKYSSGVYTLQVFINDDVVTEKLVLTR